MKKTSVLIIAALAIAVITTATIVIKAPQTKPVPLAPARVYLNEVLCNDSSEFEELNGLDRKVEAYMRKWEMKGASLAITRNDSLLYAKGYGWADEEKGIEMEPSHIMRMASVSKLITAGAFLGVENFSTSLGVPIGGKNLCVTLTHHADGICF